MWWKHISTWKANEIFAVHIFQLKHSSIYIFVTCHRLRVCLCVVVKNERCPFICFIMIWYIKVSERFFSPPQEEKSSFVDWACLSLLDRTPVVRCPLLILQMTAKGKGLLCTPHPISVLLLFMSLTTMWMCRFTIHLYIAQHCMW